MDNTTLCRAGGLVLEYTFDSDIGTTIKDTSGSGIDGTAYNNVAHATGVVGNCIAGDGVSAYVSAPSERLNLPNKTICCFLQFKSLGNAQRSGFTADSSTSFTHGSYGAGYDNSNMSITFSVKGIGKKSYFDKLTQRNFFCGKHTGNACKIRRNDEAWTSVTGNNSVSTENYKPMHLFASRTPDRYGNCTLDNFRIYNRELADYEVDNIYNNGQGC